MTCGKYRHMGKDFWNKEGKNVPKCHYCDKPGHVKKYFQRIITETNQITTRTKIIIRNDK